MSYALVRQAILERKIIHAFYGGLHREMCPHAIGTRAGREQALFYQFGGRSSSGPILPRGSGQNWRCIEIAKLSNVQLVDGPWATAPNHSRPQTCITEIDAEVHR